MPAQQQQRPAADAANKPVHTVRHRSIKATIWKNETSNGPMYNVTVVRSYRDDNGEWEFNTDWKPTNGFPVRAGWLRAVRRQHARLHRGLDVRVPVLLLRSSHSLLKTKAWAPEAMRADTVLDVQQMLKWAPKIGQYVTVVSIEGCMHDLYLSPAAVRERALKETVDWLAGLQSRDRIVE